HNYLWEPSEKEYWGLQLGDYTEWSLLVIGKKKPEFGRDTIKFNIPITIFAKRINDEKDAVDLFTDEGSKAPSLFDGVSSKFQKIFKIISIDSDLEKYTIKIKNISKEILNGISVKITGLQEGLFETAPNVTGFNHWDKDEEKEIIYETKQNISALISNLEDNTQKRIRIQTPVSVDFF
ncbi:MAG: hypothetical protein ACFFAN_10155, partial [Promethearchaeota archaeon]